MTSTTTSVTTTTCGNRNPYTPYNCLDVIPTAVPQYLDDDDSSCNYWFGSSRSCDEDDDNYGFNKRFQTWYIGPIFGGFMFCCFFAFFCCTVMKARGGNGAQGNGAQYAATRGGRDAAPGRWRRLSIRRGGRRRSTSWVSRRKQFVAVRNLKLFSTNRQHHQASRNATLASIS